MLPGRCGCEDTPVHDAARDDLDLHRRLLDGDRQAFDGIYRRYAGVAYGLAHRLTGQQMLAQDVVHDAFMAIWRAPEAFDPARGTFRGFFLSLVHHRAVDMVRKEQRLRERGERAANLEPLTVEDPAEDVADRDYLRLRSKEVREALGSLSDDQRQVLQMAYFGGMTQAQIAERLDIPLGTVKTRTLAAMRKLRGILEAPA
jgi:RNA polymerase sigma factor (sigma-70 family)